MTESKIVGIVLTIGGDRKELTLDDARQLRDELNAALKPNATYPPYKPFDWGPYIAPPQEPWRVTWSSDRTDSTPPQRFAEIVISP